LVSFNPIIKKPSGYLSYVEREMLRKELKKMLDHGVVIPASHGPNADGSRTEGWAFPVMYAKTEQDGCAYSSKT
jgi:hypothetical protein